MTQQESISNAVEARRTARGVSIRDAAARLKLVDGPHYCAKVAGRKKWSAKDLAALYKFGIPAKVLLAGDDRA